MWRLIVVIAFASFLSGCHAPVPTFDLLAPYGNHTVPAPGTGAFGSPNSYYPSAPATSRPTSAVGSGVQTQWRSQTGRTASARAMDSDSSSDRVADNSPKTAVQAASFEQEERALPGRSVLVSESRPASNSRLRALSVSDSGAGEVRLTPAEQIAERSDASTVSPNSLRSRSRIVRGTAEDDSTWHSRTMP